MVQLFENLLHQDTFRRNPSSSLKDISNNQPTVWLPFETADSCVHTEVSPANNMASPTVQCPFNDIGILLQLEKHNTCKEEPIDSTDCESSDSTIHKKLSISWIPMRFKWRQNSS